MKLAEALMLRADMQKRIAQLQVRVAANALVDAGEKPSEDPVALLKQTLGLADELSDLVLRINRTNSSAKLPDGRTLTEAIAERDALTSKIEIVRGAINAAQPPGERYSQREIKREVQFDVQKLHKQSDDLSKKLRELNARIQEANWKAALDK